MADDDSEVADEPDFSHFHMVSKYVNCIVMNVCMFVAVIVFFLFETFITV